MAESTGFNWVRCLSHIVIMLGLFIIRLECNRLVRESIVYVGEIWLEFIELQCSMCTPICRQSVFCHRNWLYYTLPMMSFPRWNCIWSIDQLICVAQHMIALFCCSSIGPAELIVGVRAMHDWNQLELKSYNLDIPFLIGWSMVLLGTRPTIDMTSKDISSSTTQKPVYRLGLP